MERGRAQVLAFDKVVVSTDIDITCRLDHGVSVAARDKRTRNESIDFEHQVMLKPMCWQHVEITSKLYT